MRMRSLGFLWVLAALSPLSSARATEAPKPLRDELLQITQALVDAIPLGDKAVWERVLTDDAVIIDEFGRVAHKADTVASMHPFPAGLSGSIELRDAHAQLYGDTAILQVEEYEREAVFGQNLVVRYQSLLTFVKQSGMWKLAGYEDVTLPTAPPKLAVADLVLGDYSGTYRYAPDRSWKVSNKQGVLSYVTKSGGRANVLEPIAKDVFMSSDDERNLLIFRRDERGKVSALLERRKFNDLRLTKEV
ncbi:nuclear transport factor 2 family protein [Dyella tabacisoli]|uniref:Nuclear transport factor 2 family protein n=1 Tax=Dyella tabacisoli TaxID=2282381 RepID=A0A369UN65_9GAMM|nr:nuclear transport factor 2 family protein [Dyella tabacisoli]RDD81515.1 nuclear transport factor 2 family protein [Dyella tabacisoli]